jgi:hypothetical protein
MNHGPSLVWIEEQNMNDHQIINLLRVFKIAKGEWTPDHKPTVRELSTELRGMNRIDVAARVEEGRTVYVLKD